MQLRKLGVLVAVLLVVGLAIILLLRREKDRADLQRAEAQRVELERAKAATAPATSVDAAVPASPRLDAQKRAELRRKILEAWATGEKGPRAAEDAKQGRFEPHPMPDGTGIDPKYVQSTVREQLFPMVRGCYEDYLTRKPDAGGQLDMWFKIVGDEKVGGIVEEDDESDAGIVSGFTGDKTMETCVRESLLSITFPPPAKGGVVTIGYPIRFAASDDDDAEDGGK